MSSQAIAGRFDILADLHKTARSLSSAKLLWKRSYEKAGDKRPKIRGEREPPPTP